MFRIADIDFEVVNSYMDAYVDDDENELVLGLQIVAKANDGEASGWEAHVNSEVLMRIKPGELKTWADIAGKVVEWEDYPDDEEEPHAMLYIFEHEPIYESKAAFECRDGEMFVKWNALCDVGWDEKLSDHLPLVIETKVSFAGILFGKGKSEEKCKKLIEPYLPSKGFKFVKNKYDVSLLVPIDGDMSTNCLVNGDY